MSLSKKIDMYRDFTAGVFICLRPPLTHCILVYSILIHTGKGGRVDQREEERGNRGEYRSQSWVENTNITKCTQENGYLHSSQ
jgi:hypothetical protein